MGFPALDIWDNLTWEAKEKVVAQAAHHLMSIFELRFSMAGSLYLSSNGKYVVGPIVDPKYFKVIDGSPVYTDARVQQSLYRFRGPFSNTSDWLSSSIKAEIFALSSTPCPSPPRVGEQRPLDSSLAVNNMNLAIGLCSKYPGNHPVISNRTVSQEPFSLMFDDFSLSNIMVTCLRSVSSYFNLFWCFPHAVDRRCCACYRIHRF